MPIHYCSAWTDWWTDVVKRLSSREFIQEVWIFTILEKLPISEIDWTDHFKEACSTKGNDDTLRTWRWIAIFYLRYTRLASRTLPFLKRVTVPLVNYLVCNEHFPQPLFFWNWLQQTPKYGDRKVLLPENGYTRVFMYGEDVTLEHLQQELTTRNHHDEPACPSMKDSITIAISYKHFAEDEINRICKTDLQAIHVLMKAVECEVCFRINYKAPVPMIRALSAG